MLTLEIEFLAGVCFAAKSQSSVEADWPPQPDRIFSALVAAWGARGELSTERAALEWLESQPAPTIEASEADQRRVGISFVPPNDAGGGRLDTLPEHRGRQPRMFPAAVPAQSLMRLQWAVSPDADLLAALDLLARDTAYVGHSASLVRCRFVAGEINAAPGLKRQDAVRMVYPGRLSILARDFQAGRRPSPGETPSPASVEEPGPNGVFGQHWLVFEDQDGWSPDLRATGILGRRVRNAVMCHLPDPPPEFLSGHQPNGEPSRLPHLAVVPLADVGHEHSEGRLMGFALVLPKDCEAERAVGQRDWLAGLSDGEPWRTFEKAADSLTYLTFSDKNEKRTWNVKRVLDPEKRSLKPARYLGACRRWGSITPVILDRHLKETDPAKREQEIERIFSSACENAGLPHPESIRFNKHSNFRGVPKAVPSAHEPSWTRWQVPAPLQHRMLTHVVVTFAKPVRGPVLVGAGRFVGLGLFLPIYGGGE